MKLIEKLQTALPHYHFEDVTNDADALRARDVIAVTEVPGDDIPATVVATQALPVADLEAINAALMEHLGA